MENSVQGVGSISSIGLGSGLDASSIIRQLMAVEARPLDQLRSQANELNAQLSNFGKLQSYTSALQDRASALGSTTLWKQTTALSSNAAAVSASTTSGAQAGNYDVQVQALATAQNTVSGTYASDASPFTDGNLTIELGTWSGTAFTPKSGTTGMSLAITAGSTLAQVRDQINAAGSGVIATIVADASGARLSMRSLATGAENAFRVTGTGGVSALSYSEGASGGMSRTQTAANAQATINGIAISSATNTLNNVVDGITLKLQAVTTAPVDISVATDTEAIRKAITDFTVAFNDLASFIREQTKYDPGTKKAGAMQGDRGALGLQGQLRAVLNQESSASATWKSLSEIGLVLKTDGTLETKTTRLDNALANPQELRKLFATDGATNAASGFAQRFKTLASQALGTDGPLEARTQSINARLTRNNRDQDRVELRLAQTESRLRAQYSALDASMAQLSNLGSYVTQQLNALNRDA